MLRASEYRTAVQLSNGVVSVSPLYYSDLEPKSLLITAQGKSKNVGQLTYGLHLNGSDTARSGAW